MAGSLEVCPWCNQPGLTAYLEFAEAGVHYLRCNHCKVLMADEQHAHHEYSDYDYTQIATKVESDSDDLPLEVGFDRQVQATYLLKRFEDAFGWPAPGIKLLDVGCGPGDFLAEVKNRYSDCLVEGIDPSATNVEDARRRYGLVLRQAYWGDEIPGKYDVITMFGNLMLHDDPRSSLSLAYDRLVAGGRLLFDVKNPYSATRRLLRYGRAVVSNHRITRAIYRQAFHGMPWGVPQTALVATLSELGFEIESMRCLPGRNAELSGRASAGIRMSAALDRWLGSEAWIECVVRKPEAATDAPRSTNQATNIGADTMSPSPRATF